MTSYPLLRAHRPDTVFAWRAGQPITAQAFLNDVAALARQLPDTEKRQRADFVVDTSHGLDPVRARIRDILDQAAKMPQRRT